MQYEVVRHSFFRNKDGRSLQYTERSPYKECENNFICNCTQSVCTRPEGIPHYVEQCVKACGEDTGRRFNFTLTRNFFGFRFYWNESHAYFDFNRAGVKDSLSIESVRPEGKSLSGSVYFGNKINFKVPFGKKEQTIVNHCRILFDHPEICLKQIGDSDVWAHYYEKEHDFIIFRKCEETEGWKRVKNRVDNILDITDKCNDNDNVDVIRKQLESNLLFKCEVEECKKFLYSILDNFEDTEIFNKCSQVYA